MTRHKRHQVSQMLPISPRMLVGVLLGCLMIVWFLLPDDITLLERYLNDQEWENAYEALQEVSDAERAKRPDFYALLDIRLPRHLVDDDDTEAIASLLKKALDEARARSWPAEYLREIEALSLKITDAELAYTILQPHLGHMSAEHLKGFVDALVKKSLASGNPLFAARIYARYWMTVPDSQEATLQLIGLARQAGQPQLALQALEQYAARVGKPIHQISRPLASLHIDLLRESNQPVRAYEALRSFYETLDPESRQALFPTLLTLARESGKAAGLLPEMLRRARAARDDAARWQAVLDMAAASGGQSILLEALENLARINPRDADLQFRLAQMLEWNSRPNASYDHYLRALRLRRFDAIDRLIALNPGLYRDFELAEALDAAGDNLNKHKHGKTLAHVYVNIGEFEKALNIYRHLLERRANDADLLKEYGQLLLDLGRYKESLEVLNRAHALAPEDLETWKALAESQFRGGDFEGALKTYAGLVRKSPERGQLENHLRLAEALGRFADAASVLEEFMRQTEEKSTVYYQRLVYFHGVLGQREKLEQTLRTAHAQFPTDPIIHKQLIYALVDNKKPAEAADVLKDYPDLIADPELTRLYLGLLIESKRFQDAEQFVTTRLPQTMLNDKAILEMLGGIYYTTGNKQAAMDLYGRLHSMEPDNVTFAITYAQYLVDFKRFDEALRVVERIPEGSEPRALKMAAQIHADAKNYPRAERYQRKYLRTNPPDSARDWGFLGDILATTGDNPGARRAYLRAITELLMMVAQTSPRQAAYR